MKIEKRVVVSCKVSKIWKLEIRKGNFGYYVQRYCTYSVGTCRYSTVRFQEGGHPGLADVCGGQVYSYSGVHRAVGTLPATQPARYGWGRL